MLANAIRVDGDERVGVTIVGGKLETPSGLEMSSSKSVRFSEISWEAGESKRPGEKNGADLFLILVRDEDREIKSKKQNKRLLTTISPVLIVNKHYAHKGDAHPSRRRRPTVPEHRAVFVTTN